MIKMKRIVIDRSKWVCGNGAIDVMGESSLLNELGRMCCLRHICHAYGVSKKSMSGRKASPRNVHHKKIPALFKIEIDNGTDDLISGAIEINDYPHIQPDAREQQLNELFKPHNIDLHFKGELT